MYTSLHTKVHVCTHTHTRKHTYQEERLVKHSKITSFITGSTEQCEY